MCVWGAVMKPELRVRMETGKLNQGMKTKIELIWNLKGS